MYAKTEHQSDVPAVDVHRVEVRPDGLVALVVPALTPARPLMAAYRQVAAQGWSVSVETLFERVEREGQLEDHIGLVRPISN